MTPPDMPLLEPPVQPLPLDLDALTARLARRPRQTVRLPGFREAAVLVPLVVEPGQPERLLFTVRHDDLRSHAGQIAFPGGKRDDGDATATATALREAEEELGIPPSSVRVLGLLDDVATPSGFVVTPIVGHVPGPLALRPCAAEVAAVFLADLDRLRDGSCYHHDGVREFLGVRYEMHRYRWSGHDIWGATGRMVHQLLEVL